MEKQRLRLTVWWDCLWALNQQQELFKSSPLRVSEEILISDTHGTISISEAGILQHLEEKERHQSVSLNVKLPTCVCSGGPAICQRGSPLADGTVPGTRAERLMATPVDLAPLPVTESMASLFPSSLVNQKKILKAINLMVASSNPSKQALLNLA